MMRPGRLLDGLDATSRLAGVLILLMLLQLVVSQTVNLYPRIAAVDFYQYWGVAAARRLNPGTLGSPYSNPRQYHGR
jgi:hypothetical protein